MGPSSVQACAAVQVMASITAASARRIVPHIRTAHGGEPVQGLGVTTAQKSRDAVPRSLGSRLAMVHCETVLTVWRWMEARWPDAMAWKPHPNPGQDH
jgi:hypothetical protein